MLLLPESEIMYSTNSCQERHKLNINSVRINAFNKPGMILKWESKVLELLLSEGIGDS